MWYFHFFLKCALQICVAHIFATLNQRWNFTPTSQSETSKNRINRGWIFNFDSSPLGKFLLQGRLCKKENSSTRKTSCFSGTRITSRKESERCITIKVKYYACNSKLVLHRSISLFSKRHLFCFCGTYLSWESLLVDHFYSQSKISRFCFKNLESKIF